MVTNNYLYVPTEDFREIQAGLPTFLYAFPGGIPRGDGCFEAQHGFSLQGSKFDAAEIQRTFVNGRSEKTLAVTYADLVSGTSTLSKDGVEIATFITTVTDETTQIALETDAPTTEANIIEFLQTYYNLDASSVGGNVKVVSDVDPLDFSTNAPTGLAITDNSDAATATFLIDGDIFVDTTQHVSTLPLKIGGVSDELFLVALVPANANKNTLTERIRTLFVKALLYDGETNLEPTAAEGILFTKNGASYLEIQAGLEDEYGSNPATAFVRTGNKLVLTQNEKGAGGNLKYLLHGIYNSIPDVDFSLTKQHVPVIKGIGPGIPLGSTQQYKRGDTAQTVNIPQDTAINDFGVALTAIQSTGSATLNQVHNAFHQRLAAGAAGKAFSRKYSYVTPGGGPLEIWGLIALTRSGKIKGQFHLDLVYEAIFNGGLQRELTKASTSGLPLQFACLADSSAAPVGFSAVHRQIAQQ